MNQMFLLARWLLRSWPVLIPAFFVALHYIAINSCFASPEKINEFFAFGLQLAGGLIILYSIDSNIGIVHNSNILKVVKKWFSEIPLFKKPSTQTITVGSISSKETVNGLRVYKTPRTIEEKISHLQTQIDWMKEDLEKQKESLQQSISKLKKASFKEIDIIKSQLLTLEGDFEEISIGGIKLQVMGVFFIVHGSFSSYIA